MYDIKIINGQVPRLNSERLEVLDVGIKGSVIVDVGNCTEQAKLVIDAQRKVVSPGFIDIHMHEEALGDKSDPYDIAYAMLLMGVTTCVAGNCGNNRQSFAEFKGYVDNNGSPVNYLSFVGHNFLRNLVSNHDRYQKSNAKQVSEMQILLDAALKGGAVGLSLGLEYCPGADLAEIVELCKVVEQEHFLVSAHYRKDAKHALASLQELVAIAAYTKRPMQVSHLGSCSAFGMMEKGIAILEQARSAGLDITADCYPYDAFCAPIGSAVFDEGCFDIWGKTYDAIMLTEAPYIGVLCNKELFYRLRWERPDTLAVAFVMSEAEVVEALKTKWVMIASDGVYRNGQGHPRGAGAFPRVLSRYVREQRHLTLLEALSKMTILPAQRLGLTEKGELREGFDADITIFDPAIITDMADYAHPQSPPQGIDYVILSGEVAMEKNLIKHNRLGRFLVHK